MTVTAVIRADDDDRLFAEVTESESNLLVDVIPDSGDMSKSMREQVRAWAQSNGHEVKSVEVLL